MFTKEALAEQFKFPFSDPATDVLKLAEDEARRFKHHYIGTEHILLGLTKGEMPALTALGVNLSQVRTAVEFIVGRGEERFDNRSDEAISFTPRSKKIIELGIAEAKKGMHNILSPNHILLGLVKEGEGIAAGILESLGVSLNRVRYQALIAPLGESTIQALNNLDDLRSVLLDPDHDKVRKEQIGMILKATLGLMSPGTEKQ